MDSVPEDAALPVPPSLKGLVYLCPQVKALLHEGTESPHQRSLIPPVTFEVSGCALVFQEAEGRPGVWGRTALAQLCKGKEPNTEGAGGQGHVWRWYADGCVEPPLGESFSSQDTINRVLLQVGAVSDIKTGPPKLPARERPRRRVGKQTVSVVSLRVTELEPPSSDPEICFSQ